MKIRSHFLIQVFRLRSCLFPSLGDIVPRSKWITGKICEEKVVTLTHLSPTFLWQRVIPVIVSWFKGSAWTKNGLSGITNRLNYCVIFILHNLQLWPRAAYYKLDGRGLDIHALIYRVTTKKLIHFK
jgi:hypothetical protein